jgi:hypothetical protein
VATQRFIQRLVVTQRFLQRLAATQRFLQRLVVTQRFLQRLVATLLMWLQRLDFMRRSMRRSGSSGL